MSVSPSEDAPEDGSAPSLSAAPDPAAAQDVSADLRPAINRIKRAQGAVLAPVRPRFVELRPDYAELVVAKRPGVLHPIGTAHAIATVVIEGVIRLWVTARS